MTEPEPLDAAEGRQITVCHTNMTVVEVAPQAYIAEGLIAGVVQRVTVSTPYAHRQWDDAPE